MSYNFIITEKPAAAEKIASALADEKPKKLEKDKVAYYEITHKGEKIIVGCAVGHLYTVAEKDKSFTYPTFDLEWKASYQVNKSSAFTKKYLNIIKNLAKQASSFTIATDYDLEGEVIGLNVIRFACNQKDAARMKFSTLTKDELIESFKNASKTLDWPQAEAGETRHFMDFLWGINLSRALTLAIKANGMFKIMSSGRVQGPALKLLTEREKEILAFKSVPYWQLQADGIANNHLLTTWHKEDKFWKLEQANDILEKIKGKDGHISKVTRKEFTQDPPHPFDLTALQLEAYKQLGINPKDTLALAQDLYSSGYISYPRTSSNQLPESINYNKIISQLAKQSKYSALCKELLKHPLKPNNGNKKDPAHPAIYPTGEIPENMQERAAKLYDLIVHRTLAAFANKATRETVKITVDIAGEQFIAEGTRTVHPGWHIFYGPYAKFKEEEMPNVKEKDMFKTKDIRLHSKQTQPPARYTPASIIKELEKKSLGTKATRANIIDSLYTRNYIHDQSIKVTDLGMSTVQTLEKYSPEILDDKLTRHFEKEMEMITKRTKTEKAVLAEAKKVLTVVLNNFKKHEKEIGKELLQATIETRNKDTIVGVCKECSGNLKITYSKKNKSYFIACSNYPNCKSTFSIPKYAKPVPTNKTCEECGYPIINMIRAGKRPYEFCINKDCKKKKEWAEKNAGNNNI